MVLVSFNLCWWFGGGRFSIYCSLGWWFGGAGFLLGLVAGLEGPLVSLSLGWLFGGAACFIEFWLVVWRGRLFHLVWVGGSYASWVAQFMLLHLQILDRKKPTRSTSRAPRI